MPTKLVDVPSRYRSDDAICVDDKVCIRVHDHPRYSRMTIEQLKERYRSVSRVSVRAAINLELFKRGAYVKASSN